MNQDAFMMLASWAFPKCFCWSAAYVRHVCATILVPAITGLSISATLLFAGLGTLLFHLITGRKVPAFWAVPSHF